MIQFKRIWYMALNVLRLFVSDRLAMGMFVLFPFLFIIMFNILLRNVGAEDPRLELHLVSQETSGLSQHLIDSLATGNQTELSPGQPLIVREQDYAAAKAAVENGNLRGFLAFPADFTQAVMQGAPTKLEVVTRAEATNVRAALEGLAGGIVSRIEGQRAELGSILALLAMQGKSQTELQAAAVKFLSSQQADISPPALVSYQSQKVGEVRPINASSYVVPGYLVMFVFFAAAIASVDIIKERRNHTLERLLASSVRRETILGGVFLGAVLRGLLQIAIFWTVGILVFHVDLGLAPWAVIVISLLMVLASAAFSLMLATLVKTERSAGAIAVLVSLVLAPLGGSWWPLFITPRWMQFLAKFTPHGWANTGFNKLMLFGAEPSAVMWEMLALVGFAALFIVIAVVNFRTSADAA